MTDLNQAAWAEADASNNSASPNGWASGTMLPSQVEPTGRAMMGAIKRWHDQISPTITSGGSANAQTLTHTVAHTALVAGDLFAFSAGFTNTGAATLNIDGLGALALSLNGAALTGGEIQASRIVLVAYNGSGFEILARSGNLGEYVEQVVPGASAISLTSGTPVTVASVTLDPGEWEVEGTVAFSGPTTTTISYLMGSITNTLATIDQTRSRFASNIPGAGATFNVLAPYTFPVGRDRFVLTAATTIALNVQAGFGTSACSAFGIIRARRAR